MKTSIKTTKRPRMQLAVEKNTLIANKEATPIHASALPSTAYIVSNPERSSFLDFTITIQNTGSEAMQLQFIGITIPLGSDAEDLSPVGTIKQIQQKAQDFAVWDLEEIAGNGLLVARPVSGTTNTLEPGKSYAFDIDNIPLNNSVGLATIEVQVKLDDDSVVNATTSVQKKKAAAAIQSFTSSFATIQPGASSTLSWQCSAIDYVIIDPLSGKRPASGILEVQPEETTNYTLYAYAPGLILSAQRAVSIKEAKVIQFRSDAVGSAVQEKGMVKLSWKTNKDTKKVTLIATPAIAIPTPLETSGSVTVGPLDNDTQFFLAAYDENSNKSPNSVLPINVKRIQITSFTSDQPNVLYGTDVSLKWDTLNATKIELDLSHPPLKLKSLPLIGSKNIGAIVQPASVTLKAINSYGVEVLSDPLAVGLIPPAINSFTISPEVPVLGEDITVAWDVMGANDLTIEGLPPQYISFAKTSQTSGSFTMQLTAQYGHPKDYVLNLKLTAVGGLSTNVSTKEISKNIQGFISAFKARYMEFRNFTQITNGVDSLWSVKDASQPLFYSFYLGGKLIAEGNVLEANRFAEKLGRTQVTPLILKIGRSKDVWLETLTAKARPNTDFKVV